MKSSLFWILVLTMLLVRCDEYPLLAGPCFIEAPDNYHWAYHKENNVIVISGVKGVDGLVIKKFNDIAKQHYMGDSPLPPLQPGDILLAVDGCEFKDGERAAIGKRHFHKFFFLIFFGIPDAYRDRFEEITVIRDGTRLTLPL